VMEYLIFAIGSGLGGMFRYAISLDPILRQAHGAILLDTVLVNAIGSFVAGFTASLSAWAASAGTRSFMVGFAGGVTTYSAFSLESLHMIHSGHWLNTALFVVISVMIYVFSAFAGFLAADWLETP
jgi:fluoride exporter